MKKIICTTLVVFFALSCMLIPASAEQVNVLDPTGLLSEDQVFALEQLAIDIEAQYGYFAMICFAENTDGYESVYEYGRALYEQYSDRDYAIIFVHDLDLNLCEFFAAENYEEYAFDSDVQNAIFNAYNEADTYYLGAIEFFNGAFTSLYNAGLTLPQEPTDTPTEAATVAETEIVTEEEIAQTEVATEEEKEDVTEDTAAMQATDAQPVETTSEEATPVAPTQRTLPLVVDYADIFTAEEEAYFLERCQAFTDEYKAEIAIVTVTDLEGKDVQAYADDFYDYNGYGYGENRDGLLCVYLTGEEGEQKLCLSTHGTAQQQITDDEIEDILLTIKGSVIYEEYKDAFDWYLNMAEEAVKPVPPLLWLLICLAVGLVIGLLITNVMASANKSVHKQDSAADYVRQGSLFITDTNDVFVGTRVKSVPKPKSNSGNGSSEGGSSSHTSSSGRTHGGGSISF